MKFYKIQSMIIQFTLSNFRSFKSLNTISFVAENKLLQTNKSGLIQIDDGSYLLPTTAIFGANASGKSNIIKAIHFMFMIINGYNHATNISPASLYSDAEPFLLNASSREEPIMMEIIIWDPEKKREYCYGIKLSRDRKKSPFEKYEIIEEWLSVREKAKQRFITQEIFRRNMQNKEQPFVFKNKRIGSDLERLVQFVSPEDTAVSIFKKFNDPIASDFCLFIERHLHFALDNFMTAYDVRKNINYFQKAAQEKKEITSSHIKKMMKQADLSIQDLDVGERTYPLRDGLSYTTLKDITTIHRDDKDDEIRFALGTHESVGTEYFFYLSILIARALSDGGVVVVDDLGSHLHPMMTRAIVEQFENKETNPKGAQLIYNTHETFLMSKEINLRRDQIWFTEKNEEATELIRLSDFKIRQDHRIYENYIMGRFGAVPALEFDAPED